MGQHNHPASLDRDLPGWPRQTDRHKHALICLAGRDDGSLAGLSYRRTAGAGSPRAGGGHREYPHGSYEDLFRLM